MDADTAPDEQSAPGSNDLRLPSRVEQDAAAADRAQQAVLGSGTQNAYFGDRERAREPAVSVAPPVGQRDEQLPLRGRDQILAEISGSGVRVWVVYGLGGCGKTRLALEAAFQAQQEGVTVWWVSAADPTNLVAGMRAVGRRLGVSDAEMEHGDATDVIWHYLAGRADRWLLVMDNADDPQVLTGPGKSLAEGRGWLRPVPGQAGRVLVTSRDGHATSWGTWCHRHRLGVLPPDEAAAVLADHAGHHSDLGSEDDARGLAVRLGGLPLALKIAGAYLADAAATPHIFAEAGQVRSYRQYQQAINSGDFNTVFPAAGQDMTQEQARELIGRTWDLTLDLLEARQMPEARPLLRLLAVFADAPLPYQMLLHPASLAASPLFAGMTGPRLWQVISTLDDSGLLDLAASGDDPDAIPVARLHPLVRDTSRLSTSPADQLTILQLAAELLEQAADQTGQPTDPATWPAWQLVAPHATHLLAALDPQSGSPDDTAAKASDAAHGAAQYQAELGLYAQADDLYRNVLATRLRVLGPDHPDTLATRHELAYEMAEQGDHAGAEAEYRDVLAASLRLLGPDHQDTLATRHELARMMAALGDHAGAEAEYRDILATRLRLLGPDHQDTLATRHEVARMMAARGDHAGAEAEYRDVLADKVRDPGPDHPSTLTTRYAVAYEMAARGDHAGAEAEFRDVLAVEARVLGPDHPSTLITRQEVARMMAARGDHAGAEAEYRYVLATRLRLLGTDHPSTLDTRHEIARMMAAQGDHAGAEAEFRDVLADKVRVLGPDHPSTKATASWLPTSKP